MVWARMFLPCGGRRLACILARVARTGSPSALPPPPPPDTSLTIEQLSRAAHVRVSTIRYYVAHGALTPPEFHSRNTRYGRDFLVRLRAVCALRAQRLKLAAIIPRLDAASPQELLRLAGYAAPPAEPGQAAAPKQPGSTGSPAGGPSPQTAARPLAPGFLGPYRGAGAPSERWEHIEICPGVKLLVRSEADAEAWRVAREIVATFGIRG